MGTDGSNKAIVYLPVVSSRSLRTLRKLVKWLFAWCGFLKCPISPYWLWVVTVNTVYFQKMGLFHIII